MMKENANKYLRSKEVAWILDCSPDEVIELARKKKLKAEKQGRFWHFRERDIMAYISKQEGHTTT